MDLKPLVVVMLFSTSMLAGCFGETETDFTPRGSGNDLYPEPWDRSALPYDDTDIYARVSVNGSYAIDSVRSVYVPVPTITAADGGAGLTGDATVHLGLWLPVIEGCDWESESVDPSCQVPVIAEVGPYYNDGDVDAQLFSAAGLLLDESSGLVDGEYVSWWNGTGAPQTVLLQAWNFSPAGCAVVPWSLDAQLSCDGPELCGSGVDDDGDGPVQPDPAGRAGPRRRARLGHRR